MREIPLTRGRATLVDDHNFDWLNHYCWYAMRAGERWYAVRKRRLHTGEQRNVFMHREIVRRVGLVIPEGSEVDHWDTDGLHNWELNLRVATRSQNMQNRRKWSGCSSRFKGVVWDKTCWRVRITIDGTQRTIGFFNEEIDAALAYDRAAQLAFGVFARLNFPERR